MVREAVAVLALGIRGRGALGRNEPDGLPFDRLREEWEGETAEVSAAAETGDHDVRVGTDLLELSLRLEADDRLMEQDMVQDGSEAIDRFLVPLRVFKALGHRDAERARMVRLFRKQCPPHARLGTRGRVDRGPVELHELSPLDLPVMYSSNPIDRRLEIREARRVGEGGPPLPCARLGRQPLVALLFRVPSLSESRVHLVATGRAIELRLVVEVRRGPKPGLEAASSDQRSRPTGLAVQLLDFGRNADPALGR